MARTLRNYNAAQLIVLRRLGAIILQNGHTVPTPQFPLYAKTFARLRKQGFSYPDILKKMENDKHDN